MSVDCHSLLGIGNGIKAGRLENERDKDEKGDREWNP